MPGVSPHLLGRGDEFAVLRDAVDDLVDGTGGCVVVDGAPEMGKAQVVDAAVRYARRRPVTVLTGRVAELDLGHPLSSLAALVQQHPELDGLLDADPSQLAKAFEEAIAAVAAQQPVLVVQRDAHWTDSLTAAVLGSVAAPPVGVGVLWVFTCEPGVGSVTNQRALNWMIDEGATHLHLGSLDPRAAVATGAAILGADLGDDLESLATGLARLPMLLYAVLQCLRDSNAVRVTGGRAAVWGDQPPAGLGDLVRRRALLLEPGERDVFDAAIVLGSEVSVDGFARLCDRAPAEVAEAVASAVARGLMVESGGRFRVTHRLFRQALYPLVDVARRTALHARVAAVLSESDGPAADIAGHLLRAGDGRSLSSAIELIAGDDPGLVAADPATAAALALEVLELLSPDSPDWSRCAIRAVHALSVDGRVDRALEVGERALHAPLSTCDRAELLLWLADASKNAGRNAEVVHYTEAALGIATEDGLRARLLALRAHALILANRIDEAADSAETACRLAGDGGEAAASAFALSALTVASRATGDLRRSLEVGREAASLSLSGGAAVPQPTLWYARTLLMFDRFDEADRLFAAGTRGTGAARHRWAAPMWHFHRADARWLRGQVASARSELDEGLSAAEAVGSFQLLAPLHGLAGQVELARGEVDAARHHLDEVRRLVDVEVSVHPSDLAAGGVLWALARGDHEAAVRIAEPVVTDRYGLNLLLTRDYGTGPLLVRLACAVGRADLALAVREAMDGLARGHPEVESLVGCAHHVRALVSTDPDEIRAAVDHLRACPRPRLLAAALEDAADLDLGGSSRDLRREASVLWDELGVVEHSPLRAATGAASRTAGQRRASVLTDAEERVVRLVVRGLTNREVAAELFLSRHTVDSHLRHAFGKAGVNSRVALAHWYFEQPGASSSDDRLPAG